MTLEQIAALSVPGKGAMALFIIGWLGAALSAARLLRRRARFGQPGFSVWSDADLRPKFIRFVSLCAVGVASALIGFTFGGWPTR